MILILYEYTNSRLYELSNTLFTQIVEKITSIQSQFCFTLTTINRSAIII